MKPLLATREKTTVMSRKTYRYERVGWDRGPSTVALPRPTSRWTASSMS
jgi:hypothetical protein